MDDAASCPGSKTLVFVVAYNAERSLAAVLDRIPYRNLGRGTEVLVVDDSSHDGTFEVGVRYTRASADLPLTVLRTPFNQGYGGNQNPPTACAQEVLPCRDPCDRFDVQRVNGEHGRNKGTSPRRRCETE
jgi:hypothetical protein